MARKLNKKFLAFLIILTLVVVGGTMSVFVVQKLRNRNPDRYIKLAEEAHASGNYIEEAKQLGNAVARRPSDPELRVRAGDAYLKASATEGDEAIRNALRFWDSAVQTDPKYVPALKRLTDFYRDQAAGSARAEVFSQLQEYAQRLSSADPSDIEAAMLVPMSTLTQRMRGIAIDPEQIDSAFKKLKELAAANPDNSELALNVASFELFQSGGLPPDQREEAIASALKNLDDGIAAHPEDATWNWRGSLIYGLAVPNTANLDKRAEREARMYALNDKAMELIKPTDPQYVTVMMTGAEMAMRRNKPDDAEKIYLTLRQQQPTNQRIRYSYAALLRVRPGRSDDAIAVLEMPISSPDVNALTDRNMDIMNELLLNELRIEKLPQLQGADRDAMVARIETGLKRLEGGRLGADNPGVLKLRGSLELAQGQTVAAIQTLNKAQELIQQSGQALDYGLMLKLAAGYRISNQTGQAKGLLETIARDRPDFLPARMNLAELLLNENDLKAAAQQLEYVEQHGGSGDDLARLKMRLAQGQGRNEDAATVLLTMPEDTPEQMRRKALLARQANNPSEVVRLVQAARATDKQLIDIDLLVWAYQALNQKDQALAVAKEALATDGDNPRLKLLEAGLRDAPQDEIEALRREVALSAEDPFERELGLYAVARSENKPEEALTHLQQAEKIKPDDTAPKQLLFDYYLGRKDFTNAERYAYELQQRDQTGAKAAAYWFRLALAKGEYDHGIDIARETTVNLPEFSSSWLMMGKAYQAKAADLQEKQQTAEARALFEQSIRPLQQALEKQSTSVEAVKGLIASYYALGQNDEALKNIRLGQQRFPNDSYFDERYLLHVQSFGNPEDAIALRLERVKQSPDSPMEVAQLAATYLQTARFYSQKGNASTADKNVQDAQRVLDEALKRWPDDARLLGVMLDLPLFGGDAKHALEAITVAAQQPKLKDKPETQLLLAEASARAGQVDKAVEYMQAARKLSNDDPQVVTRLAAYLAQNDRIDEALGLLKADSDNLVIRRQRIQILLGANRLADAEKELNQALQANPKDSDLLSQLGALYLFTGRFDQAEQRINEALVANPVNETALLNRGRVRLERQNPDVPGAVADLVTVRDRNPNNADARFALAEAYRRQNNISGAIIELETALRLQPANARIRERLLTMYTSIQPQRWADAERLIRETRAMDLFAKDAGWAAREAMMWSARGDRTKALATIRAAIQADPASLMLLQNYLDILLSAEQYQEILKETDKLATASQPGLWWVHHARAIAQSRLKQRDAALAEYEKTLNDQAVVQNPDVTTRVLTSMAREIGAADAVAYLMPRVDQNPQFKLLAVRLQQMAGNNAEMLKLLGQMESSAGSMPADQQVAIYRTAAMIYSAAPNLDPAKAEQSYKKVLEINPNDLASLNNLAVLLVDLVKPARPSEALTYSQRAMDLIDKSRTRDPYVQDTHGWVLIHIPERRSMGINLLYDLVGTQPLPDTYYHLGEGFLLDNNPAEALRQLTAAQQLQEKQPSGDPELSNKITDAIARAQQQEAAK